MAENTSGGSLGQAEKGETGKGGGEFQPEGKHEPAVIECLICKSEIKKGAKKCIRCNSFQHPLRRFLAGVDIKSLVALIPIITLSFVFVKDQIVVHKSDLRVAIMDLNRNGVKIAVSNLGDRAAILHERAELLIVANGVADPRPRLLLKDPKAPGVPLIKPGESAVMEFLAIGKDGIKIDLDQCPPEYQKCEYNVSFHVIAFDQEQQKIMQSYVIRGGAQ
jgi:hypothetical protein